MELYLEPEPHSWEKAAAVVVATAPSPGSQERLAREEIKGKTLLQDLVSRFADLALVVVVVRDGSDVELLDGFENVVVVVDPEWEESSAPLRAGLDFLAQSGEFVEAFIAHIDTPVLPPGVCLELSAGRRDGGTLAAVPKYRYARGGPALIGADLWPHFLGLEGELDVDAHLLAHPQWVTEVRVDYAPPRRIETASDLLEVAG